MSSSSTDLYCTIVAPGGSFVGWKDYKCNEGYYKGVEKVV